MIRNVTGKQESAQMFVRIEESLPEMEKQTYSVTEVSQILGLGRVSTYRAIHRGEIPSIRFNGRILVPRSGIECLLGRGLGSASHSSQKRIEGGNEASEVRRQDCRICWHKECRSFARKHLFGEERWLREEIGDDS